MYSRYVVLDEDTNAYHMAQPVSPEQRAKIISAVKDEGMAIVDAAKTYSVTASTIRKWLRKQSHNAHTSSTEVQRLKQEVQELQAIIGKMVWQQETKRKGPRLGA